MAKRFSRFFVPWLFCLAGCGRLEIAGGASEIGNPNRVAQDEGGDSPGKVVGFQFNATGTPLELIHRKSSDTSSEAHVDSSTDNALRTNPSDSSEQAQSDHPALLP